MLLDAGASSRNLIVPVFFCSLTLGSCGLLPADKFDVSKKCIYGRILDEDTGH